MLTLAPTATSGLAPEIKYIFDKKIALKIIIVDSDN